MLPQNRIGGQLIQTIAGKYSPCKILEIFLDHSRPSNSPIESELIEKAESPPGYHDQCVRDPRPAF